MEKFNGQNYRDNLAKDLKSIPDHEERAEALKSEQGSWRYVTAEERHLIAVGEHPEKMRLKRLKEIEYEKTLAPKISSSVSEACEKIEKDGRPFPEYESYYSRSSHSNWGDYYGYNRWLVKESYKDGEYVKDRLRSALRHLGDKFPEYKDVDVLLQKFSLMGYVLSATSDEIEYDKNPDKWFHFPLSGVSTTLEDYLGGDFRTVDFDESKNPFANDEKIKGFAAKIDDILKKLSEASIKNDRGFVTGYIRSKRDDVLPEIVALRDELKDYDLSLAKEINALLVVVEKKLDEEEGLLKNEQEQGE
jgi:hypothetical protein